MIIDVGRTSRRHIVTGAVVGAVLGGPAAVGAVISLIDGEAGVGVIIMLLFGLALLVLPVATIVDAKVHFRPRHLVFEGPGLRWADPRGAPWFVPWHEVASVVVHGHVTRGDSKREPLVFLHVYPADETHVVRHPEMVHLWNTDGDRGAYRIQLSFSKDYIPRLDAAMKRFAPGVYRGVVRTEGGTVIPLENGWPGVLEAGRGRPPGRPTERPE